MGGGKIGGGITQEGKNKFVNTGLSRQRRSSGDKNLHLNGRKGKKLEELGDMQGGLRFWGGTASVKN